MRLFTEQSSHFSVLQNCLLFSKLQDFRWQGLESPEIILTFLFECFNDLG